MADPVLTRGAQEELFQRHFDASYSQLEWTLRTSKAYLKVLTHERMFGIGYDTYGDQTFWLPISQTRVEQSQELADAIMYGIAECFQMKGTENA